MISKAVEIFIGICEADFTALSWLPSKVGISEKYARNRTGPGFGLVAIAESWPRFFFSSAWSKAAL